MGMSERRARQLEDRRSKILDSALRLFHEEGYETITMQDIADASEISKGSLYLQFTNKEDLIVSLLERTFDRLEEIVQRESATPGSARERLDRIVQDYIALAREDGGRSLNLWLLPRLSPQPDSPQQTLILSRIERLSGLVTVIFDEGAKEGTVRGDIDANNLIRLFSLTTVIFMERISMVRIVAPMVDTSEEKLLKEFLDILLYYISPSS
jgi:TetR/AcrR family transcriptional regulator